MNYLADLNGGYISWKNKLICLLLVIGCLTVSADILSGQTNPGKADWHPEEGMDGKNVPWITTPQALVDKMLEMAGLSPEDLLIDLGSGDGRLVISAAKLGAKAIGVEYNPDLVKFSRQNAVREGVARKVQFVEGDIFEYDFSKATVISMFLLPEINMKLRPKLLNMKAGTRIVSNTFTMQEWEYDDMVRTAAADRWNTAYLWIVPAKVEGTWNIPRHGELRLKQEFQMVKGVLVAGNRQYTLSNGRLKGTEIRFTANGKSYSGRISGNSMEGTYGNGGSSGKWSATR